MTNTGRGTRGGGVASTLACCLGGHVFKCTFADFVFKLRKNKMTWAYNMKRVVLSKLASTSI